MTNQDVLELCETVRERIYDLTVAIAANPKGHAEWLALFQSVATVCDVALRLSTTTRHLVMDGYPW